MPTITHAFVNPHEDSPDDTITRPSDWNENHVVVNGYTIVAVDYTVLTSDDYIEVTAQGKTITLPTAVGRAGQGFHIDNSSSGNITVAGVLGQTIHNELTQIILPGSNMFTVSNGTNWRIK